MIDPVDQAVRAIARRHSSALVWLQFGIAHLVLLAGVGLLSLYEPISTGQFWVLVAVSQAVVVLDNVVVSTDETGTLAQSFNTMIEGLDERDRLRSAFGAFVDPGLAERVIREGSDLAGEEVEVSILFLDIRDFTAFAERSQPTEVVALLSDLWELAVPVLLRHGGHANKFIGDGLLGVFGAPEPLDDHADRALRAALEIADRVRREFHGRIEVGIGINSGPVVAGTVGGSGRVEFTVIGDVVNTAARVEAATRETGDQVLITEDTRRRLRTEGFELDERKAVELKGKQVAVRLWAPRAYPADASGHDRAGVSLADRT